MNEVAIPLQAPEPGDAHLRQLQAEIRRLEHRDWWLWATTVVVTLLLVSAVVALSFPALLAERDWFFRFNLNQAVTGLVAAVLLFNTYAIYQQVTIKRLRRSMSEQIESVMYLRARTEELHKQAVLDPLTGLYNRRYADERLKAEAARSTRHGYVLSVLVFDLNNFKPINDRLGHAAGDLVLKEFAIRLQSVVRASDLAVRTGGDEFMIILPECSSDQVPTMLSRIGTPDTQYHGEKILIEYAAGWAGFRSGETPEKMLERADAHLYENKRRSKMKTAMPATAGRPATP
jgi:diguanylate cyclase (GGDEF)-like protein